MVRIHVIYQDIHEIFPESAETPDASRRSDEKQGARFMQNNGKAAIGRIGETKKELPPGGQQFSLFVCNQNLALGPRIAVSQGAGIGWPAGP